MYEFFNKYSNRKFRSRSASHSEKRFNSGKFPKNGSQYLTSSQNNLNKLQNKNLSTKIHTPRASKSATLNNSKEVKIKVIIECR